MLLVCLASTRPSVHRTTKLTRHYTSRIITPLSLLYDVSAHTFTTLSTLVSVSAWDLPSALALIYLVATSDSPTLIMEDSILSATSLKALAETLLQWRGMLPKELQWAEDDPTAAPFPAPSTPSVVACKPVINPGLSHTPSRNRLSLFSTELSVEPSQY
jgi:hypothetical protein